MWHAWERTVKCIRFGERAQRKETSWKTDGIRMDLGETGWGGGGVYSGGSGGGLVVGVL
jgi:hypothetical protein